MPGHCCENSIPEVSGQLSEMITRLTERIAAISEEIRETVEKIKACPAPCEDGTVSVLLLSGQSRRFSCPIVSQECAYAIRQKNGLDRFLAKIMLDAGVPLRHIDNFCVYRKTAAVEVACTWEMKGFLVLSGISGVGKSFGAASATKRFLAGRISNRLDRATWKAAEQVGKNVMWCSADDISGDRVVALKARDRLLLVIDDLGSEGASFEGQNAIRDVISKRYDSKLPTVITTGLTMLDIRNKYGRYIVERLLEDVRHGGKIVECGDLSVRSAG
jgi:hypothetical protein